MQKYKITSDSQKHGRITKEIWADDYPEALLTMDNIVDEMDGHFERITSPPLTLTFDELESGFYGAYQNYSERVGRWHYILSTGWFYTGTIGSEIGRRCSPMEKLDSVMFHY
jgi:hypothetical protein